MRYGLTNLSDNFMLFPAPITLMYGAQGGVYICADQTYFLSGIGTPEMSLRVLLPYGAVKGTLVALPDNSGALWLSDKGVVRVSYTEASITTVSNDMGVRTAGADSGSGVVVHEDGVQTAVFTAVAPRDATSVVAGDFFDAEVIRANQV
jgi:hypothetical protein